jgi:hypothetical protein
LALSFSAATSTFFCGNSIIDYTSSNEIVLEKKREIIYIPTCLREEITTEAPSKPSLSAMANPIPCVEAVTIAIFPFNLFAISISPTKTRALGSVVPKTQKKEKKELMSDDDYYALFLQTQYFIYFFTYMAT